MHCTRLPLITLEFPVDGNKLSGESLRFIWTAYMGTMHKDGLIVSEHSRGLRHHDTGRHT